MCVIFVMLYLCTLKCERVLICTQAKVQHCEFIRLHSRPHPLIMWCCTVIDNMPVAGTKARCFVARARQVKIFPFLQKNKIWSRDWIIHTCTRLRHRWLVSRLWLSVEVISGCTVLFGFRIINCFQEETFGNLLSRLEEEKFSEGDFLFIFFYRPPGSTLWLS